MGIEGRDYRPFQEQFEAAGSQGGKPTEEEPQEVVQSSASKQAGDHISKKPRGKKQESAPQKPKETTDQEQYFAENDELAYTDEELDKMGELAYTDEELDKMGELAFTDEELDKMGELAFTDEELDDLGSTTIPHPFHKPVSEEILEHLRKMSRRPSQRKPSP